jgi:cation diffusion facilitator family transporter
MAKNDIASELIIKEDIARDKRIIKTSVIGIIANVLLAAFKATVGFLSNSIAIVLDAVNNTTDAASSIITIVGTKLAGKAPDRKHPFGHGRAEYLSALIIAVIILYAGLTSLVEAIKKMITPQLPDYKTAALIVVSAAVIVKLLLGRYFKKVGRQVNSSALVNSGADALLDAVIALSTLAAAAIYIFFGISLEAYLAALISAVIIKTGISMMIEALSSILGERVDLDFAKEIKKTVCSFEGVSGAYDLVLNNYGPNKFNGSVHIEIPDTYSADMIDELLREITVEVYRKHKVVLTAIGVYSINTKDEFAKSVFEHIKEIVTKEDHVLQIHGFFINREKKTIRFDIVVSFDVPDRNALYKKILDEVQAEYPDYQIQIALDTDYTQEEMV